MPVMPGIIRSVSTTSTATLSQLVERLACIVRAANPQAFFLEYLFETRDVVGFVVDDQYGKVDGRASSRRRLVGGIGFDCVVHESDDVIEWRWGQRSLFGSAREVDCTSNSRTGEPSNSASTMPGRAPRSWGHKKHSPVPAR